MLLHLVVTSLGAYLLLLLLIFLLQSHLLYFPKVEKNSPVTEVDPVSWTLGGQS